MMGDMTTGTGAQTTVLLTGFEPFGGQTINPSWSAVQEVRRTWAGSEDIRVLELPVDFASVDRLLTDALETVRPDVVICVGQAGGAGALRLERVAINVDDARIPDNQGRQPVDEPIVPGGPAAYFSTLPIKAAVAELGRLGLPAVVSQTAGTYTCNHVFYRLMHEIGRSGRDVRGGFVHVPFAPDQAVGTESPSMAIDAMARGVAAVLATTLSTSVDARIGGGSLH
jgi:pyroglutamyl-peptidase